MNRLSMNSGGGLLTMNVEKNRSSNSGTNKYAMGVHDFVHGVEKHRCYSEGVEVHFSPRSKTSVEKDPGLTDYNKEHNRRQFPRIKTPIYCRPTGQARNPLVNIGLGGVRVFSDDPARVGERLEIELFLPDESSLICKVQVAWVSLLPEDAPAKYDVGLEYVDVPPGGLQRIAAVVEKTEKDQEEGEGTEDSSA
ncbi:MAG: PilZ domain-containing protein [Myxococcota bacterium]